MFERLIDLLEKVFGSLLPFVVIPAFEKGVLLRFGKFVKVLEPGFHWIWPLRVDDVHRQYTVLTTHRISGLATTTKDGVAVGFDAVVTYKISDVEKAVLEVFDVTDAVLDACAGVIGTALADSTWSDLLHGQAIDELTAACRKRGRQYGVQILNVQLTGLARVRTIRLTGLPSAVVGAHHSEGAAGS